MAGNDNEKEDISTRVLNGLTAVSAAFAARKVLSFAWTRATGKQPPTNPEDPGVALAEALAWSVLVGITVGAVRVLAIRAVARRTLSGGDREPAVTAKG